MKKLFFIAQFIACLALSGDVDPTRCGIYLEKNKIQVEKDRSEFLSYLIKNDVPVFLKKVGDHDLPVVLVQSKNIEKLNDFLLGSIGYETITNPQWGSDHGTFRLGQWEIDANVPGRSLELENLELHNTGLGFKDFGTWVKYQETRSIRRPGSTPCQSVQTAYRVTKQEMDAAGYYMRMRRAAIYRVKFSMGDQALYEPYDNVLQNCSNHCFEFSYSSSLSKEMDGMRGNLKKYGVDEVDAFLLKPAVIQYLDKVKESLLKADLFDETHMNEGLLVEKNLLPLIRKFVPKQWSEEEILEFCRWLVGYHASLEYSELMKELGVKYDLSLSNLTQPRISAILVFDSSADAEQRFRNATYSLQGKIFNFSNDGARVPQ